MSDERLSIAVEDLTATLKEILEWLKSHKVDPGPRPPLPNPKDPMNQPADVTYKCPLCNGKMVKRIARATGESFFGCAKFPDCKGTRNIDGKDSSRGAKPPRQSILDGLEDYDPPF